MTTFAPNFTPRWRGHYIAAGVQHAIQFRAARGTTFATMDGYRDRARELFAFWTTVLADDFEWVSAEVALTDEDLFNPATTPTVLVPGTIAVADFSAVAKVRGLSFSGRAPASRSRFTMFGLLLGSDTPGIFSSDTVITGGEVAAVNSSVTLANTYFYSGSGILPIWHPRATYKENDHLLKLVRRGIIS